MSFVHVVQHAEGEGPGTIGEALAARGVALEVTQVHRGQRVPRAIDGARAVVVLGGEASVVDRARYPYLADEIELVGRALDAGIPVLGICLGSQVLAAALGARVLRAGAIELGFRDVDVSALDDALFAAAPRTFSAFHWHSDVFELPRGATSLARSLATPHQAFRFGERAWGIQFHLEVREIELAAMIEGGAEEIARAGETRGAIELAASAALPSMIAIARRAFDAFAELVVA